MTQNRMQKVVTKTKNVENTDSDETVENYIEERDWKTGRPQQQRNKPKHYREE